MKKEYVRDFRNILKAFPGLKKWEINQLKKRYRKGIVEIRCNGGMVLTNDPVKMLGCGTSAYSSYSPTAPFYKHLPSWICQDYVMMVYKSDGEIGAWKYNGVEFRCPGYLTRAFVVTDGNQYRFFGFYGDPDYALRVPIDQPSLLISVDCPPPTIHLDEGILCKRPDGKEGHTAIFVDAIPSQDHDCFKYWNRGYKYV